MSDVLRWSQRAIDLADGDPSKGNFIIGSPLAAAFTMRAIARYCLGRPGWRDDLRHGLAMTRGADPMSYANAVAWVYLVGIPFGVVAADDRAVRESAAALQNAERCGDDYALAQARAALGMALVHRHTAAERGRGQQLLAEVSEMVLRTGQALGALPLLTPTRSGRGLGAEITTRPSRSCAPPSTICSARDSCCALGVPTTGVLVQTLLDRGTDADVAEAEAAIERLAAAPAEEGLVIRDIWLLRLRALLSKAHGDDVAYRDFGIAIAPWRYRLASKDTSPGPRRCEGREHCRIRRFRECFGPRVERSSSSPPPRPANFAVLIVVHLSESSRNDGQQCPGVALRDRNRHASAVRRAQ